MASKRKQETVAKLDYIALIARELFKTLFDGEDPEFAYYDDNDTFLFGGWSERFQAHFHAEIKLKGKSLEEAARLAMSRVINFKPPRDGDDEDWDDD